MPDWLKQSFAQQSVLWLLLSSIIGGVIGASVKLVFEVVLPDRIQNKRKTRQLITKYSDPILRSAFDLQSRLYNILKQSFLTTYYHSSERDKEYAIKSTLYAIAEYFAWIEILRKEVQFLIMGNTKTTRKLQDLLANTRKAFSSDKANYGTGDAGKIFRVFRGDQRAIGEIMIRKNGSPTCIGYTEFVTRLNTDPGFAIWFDKLEKDIPLLANKEHSYNAPRLALIHNSLIDILDFFDPKNIRIHQDRERIVTKASGEAAA